MGEYTGKFFTIENCERYGGCRVNYLEYKAEPGHNLYLWCSICGRRIKSHWFVPQDEYDCEYCDIIGPECVKKVK